MPLFSCKAALGWFRHVAVGHLHDFLKTPNVVAQASGHRTGDPQRFVDSGEIVVYGMNRNHCRMILDFL